MQSRSAPVRPLQPQSSWSSSILTNRRPGAPPSGSRAAPPRFVPNRGHSALTLTPPAPSGLRAPLAQKQNVCSGRACCSLHHITAFSPSRAASTLVADDRHRPLTFAPRRAATVPGSSARAAVDRHE